MNCKEKQGICRGGGKLRSRWVESVIITKHQQQHHLEERHPIDGTTNRRNHQQSESHQPWKEGLGSHGKHPIDRTKTANPNLKSLEQHQALGDNRKKLGPKRPGSTGTINPGRTSTKGIREKGGARNPHQKAPKHHRQSSSSSIIINNHHHEEPTESQDTL